MSLSSVTQLRESYKRIISATLKKARDSGVLGDAGPNVADELERRWRAAAEQRLASMEKERSLGPIAPFGLDQLKHIRKDMTKKEPLSLLDSTPPDGWSMTNGGFKNIGAASSIPAALKNRQAPPAIDAPLFAEPFEMPVGQPEHLPAVLQCAGGFDASQRDTTAEDAVGSAAMGTGRSEPPPKRRRTITLRRHNKPNTSAETPLVPIAPGGGSSSSTATTIGTAGNTSQVVAASVPVGRGGRSQEVGGALAVSDIPAAAAAGDSDDEYAGCFDDAEVVIAQAAVEAPPLSLAPLQGVSDAACGSSGALVGDSAPSNGGKSIAATKRKSEGSRTAGGSRSDLNTNSTGDADTDHESELGSDLDCPELDEPPTNNVLYAVLGNLKKTPKKWVVDLRQGVLQIDGVECLISSGRGEFTIDEDFQHDEKPVKD